MNDIGILEGLVYAVVLLFVAWGFVAIWRQIEKDKRDAEDEYNKIANLLKEVDQHVYGHKK